MGRNRGKDRDQTHSHNWAALGFAHRERALSVCEQSRRR